LPQATLIPYVRPDDLRRELNERFRDSHPEIDQSITLSKIRRLKELMIEVGQVGQSRHRQRPCDAVLTLLIWHSGCCLAVQEVDIEAATIACAFSFMERLIISVGPVRIHLVFTTILPLTFRCISSSACATVWVRAWSTRATASLLQVRSVRRMLAHQ